MLQRLYLLNQNKIGLTRQVFGHLKQKNINSPPYARRRHVLYTSRRKTCILSTVYVCFNCRPRCNWPGYGKYNCSYQSRTSLDRGKTWPLRWRSVGRTWSSSFRDRQLQQWLVGRQHRPPAHCCRSPLTISSHHWLNTASIDRNTMT